MNNADSSELDKFSALAHRWWDPRSEFKPLHDINPLRLDWIRQRAQLQGKKALDVGCGGGILAESMDAAGAAVTGIDLSEKALGVARLHLLESGRKVDYREIPAEDLARNEAEGYDIVTCMELLEHVPNPQTTIAACAALLRPGGHLFLSTLNRNPKSWLFAIVGAEYLLRLLPKGMHDYSKFIKPSELARWVKNAGLEVAAITGMSYRPITRSYTLGEDASVNYLMHAVKPASI
ncbi:MAG: bifunctional 2-polyprenyl-6-hydroxyphenol methylase/3-demethylubiquinol 3-O-methyltransferase UbiG [Betaproteobacteria bacterium]|nr:bifunctional 2-polyprenyl-6-hydroxyphenol methylase/3-demethylubiquinol 3-O-methyltransferase UbiG [Betaproteobacteria bacterium]